METVGDSRIMLPYSFTLHPQLALVGLRNAHNVEEKKDFGLLRLVLDIQFKSDAYREVGALIGLLATPL